MTTLTDNHHEVQAWLSTIQEVQHIENTVLACQIEFEDAERLYEQYEIAVLLPELLKGKDGQINGSNEAIRKLQTQEFLDAQPGYYDARIAVDMARRHLRKAQMELDHSKLLERFYRVQSGWKAQQ